LQIVRPFVKYSYKKERLILKEIEKYTDSPEAIILAGMGRTM
jgi:hypothetical protein